MKYSKKTKMPKRDLLAIMLFILSLSSALCQTYNEITTKAYSAAYVDNNFKKAEELYTIAFKKQKPKSFDLYYAAENSLKLNNIDKFKYYLSQAVENGYANYNFLIRQLRFKTHFTNDEWDSLILRTKANYYIFEEDYKKMKDSLSGYYETSKKISGDIDLRTDSLPIKHQGQRNTCSVFAATALIENIIWIKKKQIVDLSESYNYWAAKTYALTNNFLKEIYTSIDGLAGYLAVEAYKYGSMSEKNWKYENTNWLTNEDKRCKIVNGNYTKECFTGTPPPNSRKSEFIAKPVYIDRKDIGQYILQEKKPVVMNIFWYFNAVDSLGNFSLPSDNDIEKGGHVILLIGYNSETKTFIFRNSWGKSWGQNGYGTIPEEYIMNYFELAETFPYGNDISEDEKNELIKGSMGVSAVLIN